MKKKISMALVFIMAIAFMAGCGNKKEEAKVANSEPVTLKVAVPDGIPALTMTKIIKENKSIDKNVTLEFSIEKTPDTLASKVLSKEADIAIVPSNLAAQTYNKGLDYKLSATGSWGSFFLISEENIGDLNNLKGKEITTIGKSLTPDIMLRYILKQQGLEPDKDVAINYLNGATELAPNFIGGKAKIAAVPEPMLSTILQKKPNTNLVIDLNDQWKKLTSSKYGYPQSSLIIKGEVISKHKDFVDKLLKEYEESIKWANANPEELGNYAEELKLSVNKAVLKEALKRANMNFVNNEEAKADYDKYFKMLMDSDPKTIGGKLPDENLYFKK